jgi:hypothetical protein
MSTSARPAVTVRAFADESASRLLFRSLPATLIPTSRPSTVIARFVTSSDVLTFAMWTSNAVRSSGSWTLKAAIRTDFRIPHLFEQGIEVRVVNRPQRHLSHKHPHLVRHRSAKAEHTSGIGRSVNDRHLHLPRTTPACAVGAACGWALLREPRPEGLRG